MSKPKRHYTEEFKQQSLKLLETTGKTTTEVERELGITQGLLSRRKRKQEKRGEYATNATRPDDLIDAEITQLRQENAILRQEREILKTYNKVVVTTQTDESKLPAPNLLNRDFAVKCTPLSRPRSRFFK